MTDGHFHPSYLTTELVKLMVSVTHAFYHPLFCSLSCIASCIQQIIIFISYQKHGFEQSSVLLKVRSGSCNRFLSSQFQRRGCITEGAM
ncbi:hypothetical protein P691DRAFT_93386 [Macrolepiota fuliginosa MF-IS2]|uniref:Uncharacterized protein n=1 Tax=Macrolepiota fuliginosa MF-IS2 TaxID=1400762 RepID=A0A9P5WZG7_9AGAR|nr:hypothetical protein P691DRAFT_93386 [Macrolepiota fuliginosa MF-IS2]